MYCKQDLDRTVYRKPYGLHVPRRFYSTRKINREQTKISLSYLSKIEAAGCDKSLSISVLNQIANVLSVEINEFFKEV